MPLMQAVRRTHPQFSVVLGPCPGCENWQLDYHDLLAFELGEEAFRATVEDALAEHYVECSLLQDIVLGSVFRAP